MGEGIDVVILAMNDSYSNWVMSAWGSSYDSLCFCISSYNKTLKKYQGLQTQMPTEPGR